MRPPSDCRHAIYGRVCVRTLALCLALFAVIGAPARAQDFAPLDEPGPAPTVSAGDLRASLRCSDGVAKATRTPVLLLSGTAIDSSSMYGWNVERALSHEGIPWCVSDQRGDLNTNMDDLQTRGEYVTYAIRTEAALARRKIAVVGHSQGGMIARWSLRFWPDTRGLIAEIIGVAADNHGTTMAGVACAGGCSAAERQQAPDAMFMKALNSRTETFPGIDYTEIYSHTDELVTPNADNTGTSSLHGQARVTNIAVQDVCAADNPDHMVLGTTDPVSWALIRDALTHDGPADPQRLPATVCTQGVMPGVDNASVATDITAAAGVVLRAFLTYPQTPSEPLVRCYVTASCPPTRTTTPMITPTLVVSLAPRLVPAGKRVTLRIRVRSRTTSGAKLTAVARALVWVGPRRRVRTSAQGVATLSVRFAHPGRVALRVTARGFRSKRVTLRVIRRG